MGDRPERRISIGVRIRSRSVGVWVDDSGPGLPAGVGSEIFDPYWRAPTAAVPGLGLGLATVKRLVQCYGGQVGSTPRPEGGLRVWFELPRWTGGAPG